MKIPCLAETSVTVHPSSHLEITGHYGEKLYDLGDISVAQIAVSCGKAGGFHFKGAGSDFLQKNGL